MGELTPEGRSRKTGQPYLLRRQEDQLTSVGVQGGANRLDPVAEV